MILMPASGSFAAWERALTTADLTRYTAARRREQLTLSIPKFTVRTSSLLTQFLKDLGLVRDEATGAIVFLGRYVKPEA